jgi:hypothetical protein
MSEKILETLDFNSVKRDFRIGKYLSGGLRIMGKRILWLTILSVFIGIINIVSNNWYFAIMLPIVVLPLFYAATYNIADCTRKNAFLEIDHYFISMETATSLTLTRFVQGFIQILLLFPAFLMYKPATVMLSMMFGVQVNDKMILIPGIIFILSLMYFYTAYIFTDQYIIFKQQNYWQAMTSSRKRVHKHFAKVFLLLFIIFIIGAIIFTLLFLVYLYWLYRENGFRCSFIYFLTNFGKLTYEPEAFRNAFTFLISFTYPFAYCVLHSAFADIEDLPKEETIIKSYSDLELD